MKALLRTHLFALAIWAPVLHAQQSCNATQVAHLKLDELTIESKENQPLLATIEVDGLSADIDPQDYTADAQLHTQQDASASVVRDPVKGKTFIFIRTEDSPTTNALSMRVQLAAPCHRLNAQYDFTLKSRGHINYHATKSITIIGATKAQQAQQREPGLWSARKSGGPRLFGANAP